MQVKSNESRTDKLDREILGALRMEAAHNQADRWVAVSESLLTSCCPCAEGDEDLVRQRLHHLKQIALLTPETRNLAGREVRGFVVDGPSRNIPRSERKKSVRVASSKLALTTWDIAFLKGVSIRVDPEDTSHRKDQESRVRDDRGAEKDPRPEQWAMTFVSECRSDLDDSDEVVTT